MAAVRAVVARRRPPAPPLPLCAAWRPRRLGASARAGAPLPSPPLIVPRAADFSRWYLDVVAAADLIDAGPVRGQVILKPHGYAIWEALRAELDARIRASGAVNAYFPLLVPVSFFAREAAHVEGFAKECAVVTHHRLRVAHREPGAGAGAARLEPDPAAELGEPLVVRPTSETVIWDAFSRWIKSHRDLPLVLNQWANVVRWEMRTRPFLRTSEFLWQEGHTAHATEAEARARARDMLAVYRDVCERVLAVPVVTGAKSPSERFAGADDTLTCEAMMPNGWALQSATSHFLGRNFARAFDVHFTDADGSRQLVWATSWGASTRLIGGAIMTHSDDVGLVLPPAVAPVQVVVVPIVPAAAAAGGGSGGSGGGGEQLLLQRTAVAEAAEAVRAALAAAGLRVAVDRNTEQHPGARFYAWERKGVPVRVEVGPRDVAAGVATLRDRLGGPRVAVPLPTCGRGGQPQPVAGDTATPLPPPPLVAAVQAALASVHARLLEAARSRLRDNTHPVTAYEQLRAHAAAVAAAAAQQHDSLDSDAPPGSSGGDGGGGDRLPAASGGGGGGGGGAGGGGHGAGGGGRAASSVAAAAAAPAGDARAPFRAPWRMFLAPWHDDAAAEAAVKAETSYTLRCFPDGEQARLVPSAQGGSGGGDWGRCFYSGRPATHVALFARAF